MKAEEEERDDAMPVRDSPKLERWWIGGAMAVENGGGSFTPCRR
jgi:hypothetical protein